MPKAYWVAHGDIHDPETYARYREANAEAFALYGAKFLIRGGAQTEVEGKTRARTVVIEFPSLQAATDCYHSPQYQAALAIRAPASTVDLVIVEGYEG
jgi:uncharacterized protein (DUF1330 family)